MTFRFTKDFSNWPDQTHPDGITVEKHSGQPNLLGYVRGGAYNIVFPGNRHLLLTPPLRNSLLRLACRTEGWSPLVRVVIFFRYRPDTRQGGYLMLESGGDGARIHFGTVRDSELEVRETQPFPGCREEITLETWDDRARVTTDGQPTVFDLSGADLPPQGLLGFDRGPFPGPLVIDRLTIESDDPVPPPETLWKEESYEFPGAVSCFDARWQFTLGAVKRDDLVTLTAGLKGGPLERDVPQAFGGHLPNEEMSNPYVRVEGRNIRRKILLLHGRVGRKEHWDVGQTAFPPADAECPVTRDIVLPSLPEDARIFIGYERYRAEDRIHLANGPTEMLVDPGAGKVRHAGQALDTERVVIEVDSGRGKQICGLIPEDDARAEDALAYARGNHTFFEKEGCSFTVMIRYRQGRYRPDELTLTARIEDVYHDAVSEPFEPALQEAEAAIPLPDLTELRSDKLEFMGLPVGVYHLALELRQGDALLQTRCLAFEIMDPEGKRPCPPLASGLPELYALHSDYNSSTDGFDPWLGKDVNLGHYLSGNTFQPQVARRHRIWNLVHLYQRKWLCWLDTRTLPEPDIEANFDLLEHADLAYLFKRIDLWKPDSYQGRVLDALKRFAHEQGIDAGPLAPDALDKAQQLGEEELRELVTRHWQPWLSFFAGWFEEHGMARARRLYKEANPRGKMMRYGIYPPYGSVYKGGYFSRLTAMPLDRSPETYFDGPLFFEDYPYLCGYPVQRTVYMLAAVKQEAPGLRQFPEMYSLTGVPRDAATVYGCPPYGRFHPDPKVFRKRLFEYAYGAVWFRDGDFHYWQDNGFQARNWAQEEFDVFLNAWKQVREARPRKPVRSPAFVTSVACCSRHPEHIDPAPPGRHPWPDVYNTAEEAPAFVYEQARVDGQCGGFLTRPVDLASLSAGAVSALVLPPLSTLTDEEKRAVRELHEQGVHLLCFENVDGLEDLFGVSVADAVTVSRIEATAALPGLKHVTETTSHPLCVSRYRTDRAAVLLQGASCAGASTPVLTRADNGKAFAALFTVPPTAVRRAHPAKVSYGHESISPLVNEATRAVMRFLCPSPVRTTAGKLLAFEDGEGRLRIVVEEDAHPAPAVSIQPVITVTVPGARPDRLACDRTCHVLSSSPQAIELRVLLNPHDSAMITMDIDRI